MQQTLAAIWKPGRRVFIKELDDNRFIFQFFHEFDIQRVVDGSPWYFNRKALIISRMSQDGNPRSVLLNTLDMWVQVYDLEIGHMNSSTLKAVGNYLGKFIATCPKNLLGTWRDFMRVRVTLALDVPLKRRMKIRKSATEFFWVTFRYENVPTFCFICGLMGHAEQFCPKRFDSSDGEVAQPYGDWMRAPLRRPAKLIGSP